VIGRTVRDNNFFIDFQKLRVWCSSSNAKWELGQIQSISGDDAEILLANGKVSVLYSHGGIVTWGHSCTILTQCLFA
jgi:hypothetical protein